MKKIICFALTLFMVLGMTGCNSSDKDVKIGVSLGVGAATRWKQEKEFMETRAKELGIEIEVRLNTTDKPKTQKEDCYELIDSGIDVLIITPRDVNKVGDIIEYAKKKNVLVISYSRIVIGQEIDLYVGYDSTKLGQNMGQYLAEKVDHGDYIFLKGDINDFNTELVHTGAMKYLQPLRDNNKINVILDEYVKGWNPATAKQMVKDAIKKNNNKVDAILAPNDKIAQACAEALDELGIKSYVEITGMDAEIDALKRINDGKQGMTFYLSLKDLAYAAIDAANDLAQDNDLKTNARIDNKSSTKVNAYLINGQMIVKENMKAQIIDKGIYTEDQVTK
ncbi:MAG: substrate-binding domain-containing protein [Coprobacillus sp.]